MKETVKKSELPYYRGHWLLGAYPEMVKKGVSFYPELQKRFGDSLKIRIGFKSFYLFFHPNDIREILQDKSELFIKGEQYNSLRKLLGNGLLTSTGKDWEKQRRLLNPLFGKSGLDQLIYHMEDVSKKIIANIPEGEIDWTRCMFDYSLKIAVQSFFGNAVKEDQLDELFLDTNAVMRFVSREMSRGAKGFSFAKRKERKIFLAALTRLKSFLNTVYEEKKSQEDAGKDLLGLILSQGEFSKEEIFDLIMSFLIAGHETTAMSMSWMFHLLANNQDKLQNLINEIKINESKNIAKNSLILSHYPYLDAVIKETMRLYPAGWVIARDLIDDTTVGSYKLYKNHVTAVCPLVAQRDERWWVKPEEFRPERFLSEEEMKNVPKGAFLPFSLGKRNCIGARFSELEVAYFLIEFFKKFTVTTSQKTVGMKGFVVLKADKPIMINIHKV